MNSVLIDSHCHLQFRAFDADRDAVLAKTLEKDIFINVVGTQSDTSKKAVELAEKHKGVFATVGLHPTHLFSTEINEEDDTFQSRAEDFDYDYYKKLASSPKVIGIGETGLDYFHIPENMDKEKILARQKDIFLKHYELAQELSLPLVIHVRDANDDLIEILKKLKHPIRGVAHCFTESWQYAEQYLQMGLCLGFTGIVTFPPKKSNPESQAKLLEVVKKCPLDRILVETDAPYLAPNNYRGKRCEPWMVEDVANFIAKIKDIAPDELKKQIVKNTISLFTKLVL